MIRKIEQYINDRQLLSPGDKIVVAVSGGPDSTALLLTLHQLASRWHWRLIIAHVNYHSRGTDSERDENFVRRLARKLKVPLMVKSARLNRRAGNFEEQAREIRYHFFAAVARKYQADKIAVAHTADDQVETMIQNMLRGSGLRGAAGMPVKRGPIVRPLLGVTRAEILRCLKRQHQSYRTDRSNHDLKYQRNWIRWKLIPNLHRLAGATPASPLLAAGRLFDRAAAFLERQARVQLRCLKISESDEGAKYQLAPFLALPEILQGEMIRTLLGRRDIGRQHVREVLTVLKQSEPGKSKKFKRRVIIKRRGAFVCRVREEGNSKFKTQNSN